LRDRVSNGEEGTVQNDRKDGRGLAFRESSVCHFLPRAQVPEAGGFRVRAGIGGCEKKKKKGK